MLGGNLLAPLPRLFSHPGCLRDRRFPLLRSLVLTSLATDRLVGYYGADGAPNLVVLLRVYVSWLAWSALNLLVRQE